MIDLIACMKTDNENEKHKFMNFWKLAKIMYEIVNVQFNMLSALNPNECIFVGAIIKSIIVLTKLI